MMANTKNRSNNLNKTIGLLSLALLTGLFGTPVSAHPGEHTHPAPKAETASAKHQESHSALPYLAIPGGIVSIPLNQSGAASPKVTFNSKPVMTAKAKTGEWHAIVGIPLDHKGALSIKADGKELQVAIDDYPYKEQHIEIKNTRQVNPLKNDMERIGREYNLMMPIYASFSDVNTAEWAQMIKPVAGPYSSPFGLKRFFNGQPRKPHSGIDIAAPEGTEIIAPASGRIVLTGDFFFNGKSVFIDHGQGLISMMCHLSRIDVEQGQQIQQGEAIGAVGETGRATGPHLHWTISLNNARVNPFLLMPNESQP